MREKSAAASNPDAMSGATPRSHIVVLSGAGISAESGIRTFRGGGGLWHDFRIEDVATPEAWQRDPERALGFYNVRRRQLYSVEPNAGHRALAGLERDFPVTIITQNIDNLHERAGSSNILHLHGALDKARSTADDALIYDLAGRDIRLGNTCELGSQLRPHVVWFGEMVPELERAEEIVRHADVLIVVGTSFSVYPAANLAFLAPSHARKVLVNPEIPDTVGLDAFECIGEPAARALPRLAEELRKR